MSEDRNLLPQPLDPEFEWLRLHARDYPGQWLAVLGGRLLAADPDLRQVLARLREAGERRALLHREPPVG